MENVTVESAERFKYRALAGAVMGYFFDAWDYMVLAMAIPWIVKDWHITLAQAGLIATATIAGAAIGAYFWGPMSDKFGRKKIMALCIGWFGVTTFACGFCTDLNNLILLRFISGLGLGGEWVVGAAFITEYFPPHQRARATTAVQAGWPVGYACVIALNGWLVPIYGWQILFWSGIITVFVSAYILIWVPESPAWLKNKENKLKGIESQSNTISTAGSWMDLFKGANLKITLMSMALCSCVLVSYWGSGTWVPAFLSQERHLSTAGLTWFMLAQQGVALVSYFIFGWIGDNWGRRASLIIGGTASGITIILYMTVSSMSAVFLMGLLWALAMNGFWGPLPATIAEQYPTNVRGVGVSVSYATGRVMAAIAPFAMGGIAAATSLAVALIVAGLFYFLIAVIAYFMKETKNTIVVD